MSLIVSHCIPLNVTSLRNVEEVGTHLEVIDITGLSPQGMDRFPEPCASMNAAPLIFLLF